jgi:integrase
MIYKRGKKGTYWMRFRFAGRIIHESARTRSKTLAREAERARRRRLEEAVNGVKRRRLPPTLERAAREWQASRAHVRPKTVSIADGALKHLLAAFSSRLLCDIAPEDIASYQARRQREGTQGRTVNIEIGTLRQILKAHDVWLPLAGKVRMLQERKDVARALTPEEERALLQTAAETDSACSTAVALALNTAMRKDEIRTLHWSQVDWERRTVTVGDSKTEAGAGRLIPWCESKGIDPTRSTNGWRTAWRHALKRAGFHCRFHDLRVTCITKLAESQASEQTIMAIAGHVSHRMLEHYSRIRTEAKRVALESIAGADFGAGVHQIGNQIQPDAEAASAKMLN